VLFARRWAEDQAAAEDLVQEAFVRFWRTRDGVRDPLAYVYQCVRRVAVDAVRSQQARHHREAVIADSREVTSLFAHQLEDEEQRQRIETALSELPTDQAEIVMLKIWSDLTFAQIAEVTSSPIGTVASRYRSAIERLRRILGAIELT
jgi:RNA polymerase sigma-70 factor (ECF subfamily)